MKRQQIDQMLHDQYGIHSHSLCEIPGGWSALAFKVEADEGTFFVKAYDRNRPSVQHWVQRIDLYMPLVLWLYGNTPLSQGIIAPKLTTSGAYRVRDADHIYLVFPFVEGTTVGQSQLSSVQIQQLAQTLAQLHSYGRNIPVETGALQEGFILPFKKNLNSI